MSRNKLVQGIIAKSVADNWGQAKLEWGLLNFYREDEPDTCLCGHFPIVEICELKNNMNGNIVVLGNCCAQKVLDLPANKIFRAINRVLKDIEKSLNAEALEHAYEREGLNDWERNFYLDIMTKRKLTVKQIKKKAQINQKVLHHILGTRSKLKGGPAKGHPH